MNYLTKQFWVCYNLYTSWWWKWWYLIIYPSNNLWKRVNVKTGERSCTINITVLFTCSKIQLRRWDMSHTTIKRTVGMSDKKLNNCKFRGTRHVREKIQYTTTLETRKIKERQSLTHGNNQKVEQNIQSIVHNINQKMENFSLSCFLNILVLLILILLSPS